MYGSERLNNDYVIRYSLLKEFFETFSTLTYKGIEMPPTLVHEFKKQATPHITKNIKKKSYIRKLKKKHRLTTASQAQKVLQRIPVIKRDLSVVDKRKTYLIPGVFATFVAEHLRSEQVILTISNREDRAAIRQARLPKSVKKVNYQSSLQKEKLPKKAYRRLLRKLKKLLSSKKVLSHPLFKTHSFQSWLKRKLKVAIKRINVLDKIIRKNPIGVIVERTEIVPPGTILSMLARKYNLPFIYTPPVLATDSNFLPTRASHYCAWGKNQASWYLNRGISASQITITGNLKFEYDKRKRSINGAKFKKSLHIPANHSVVLFTTQWLGRRTTRVLKNWLSTTTFAKLPLTILIKPHRNDPANYYPLSKKNKNIKVLSRNYPLYDALRNTDVVMTVSSNTAIEGALLKKGIVILQPKISYNFKMNPHDYHAHLAKAKAGPVVRNLRDLFLEFKKVTHLPDYQQELQKLSHQFLRETIRQTSTPSKEMVRLLKEQMKKRDRS